MKYNVLVGDNITSKWNSIKTVGGMTVLLDEIELGGGLTMKVEKHHIKGENEAFIKGTTINTSNGNTVLGSHDVDTPDDFKKWYVDFTDQSN